MNSFAGRLLGWWEHHGRHDLPWQSPRTPYRVWVSEIMLQQTRVETVIPYFERFIGHFGDVASLATAKPDEVLALWSGLGYYSRGRNLHRAARICLEKHDGDLPETLAELQALPGIGRTTGAAILAQAHNQPQAILDGNVKRVLARHGGIEGWPGQAAVLQRLWEEAERRVPPDRAADYTQAIMDLGAIVCKRTRPSCPDCPVRSDCRARQRGLTETLPTRKPRKPLPEKKRDFWLVTTPDRQLLLERRPPAGIWGGLWCLPEEAGAASALVTDGPLVETIRHGFTHFRLDMNIRRGLISQPCAVRERDELRWMPPEEALTLGLPQPVRKFIERIHEQADHGEEPS